MQYKKSRAAAWLLAGLIGFASSSASAAEAASDNAGNYSLGNFTNEANRGTGFGPWVFNVEAGATVQLASSIADGGGNINSGNGFAFQFYGGPGDIYAQATRAFNAPLALGDTFSVRFSYDWNGGARGVNILSASGQELFNVNYGGDNILQYSFGGGAEVVMATDFVSTSVVTVVVTQLSGNQLNVTLTRNDGLTTNVTSASLVGTAGQVKFYNGGHDGDTTRYAMYANNLVITPNTNAYLLLDGIDAMAVGLTNLITVTRNGDLDEALTVNLVSDDPAIVTVPASVEIAIGEESATFELAGVGGGVAVVTASAAGFPDDDIAVVVFDIAYDDSAYYDDLNPWVDGANGGLGFDVWTLTNNNDEEAGRFAGHFLGSSLVGGPDANASSDNAFAMYANGNDGPLAQALRGFEDIGIGESFAFMIGVNFLNGAKGADLWHDDGENLTRLLEVAVYNDDYWFQVVGQAPVSLGWDYAGDSAIEVTISRHDATTYSVLLVREGSTPEVTLINNITLIQVPNTIRFYTSSTEAGDQNNLYFNSLAQYTGVIGEIEPEVRLGSIDAMALFTNLFVVTRLGDLDEALTVNVASSDETVLAVTPASFELAIGENVGTFEVIGVSLGMATVTVSAVGFDAIEEEVYVYDIAYDDTQYYEGWIGVENGGGGFGLWELTQNTDAELGRFAGHFLGDSTFGGPDVNAADGASFGMYANGGGDSLAQAFRPFSEELGIGESFSFVMGINFRNGTKGADVWHDAGEGVVFPLIEIAVYNEGYWFRNLQGGSPINLGWDYAFDSEIHVTISRHEDYVYSVLVERSGSMPESTLLNNVILPEVPNLVRFYVTNTDNGDPENNLYVNELALYTGTIGEVVPALYVDGIDSMTLITNVFTVSRIGPTDAALTVNLTSGDEAIFTVPASVVMGVGESTVTFDVTGTGLGSTNLTIAATGFDDIVWDIYVADIAYDDTQYYTDWTGNGGGGFGDWILFSNNDDGLGRYAGHFIGDSTLASGDVNDRDDRAFGMFANGAENPEASATRPFAQELGIGESIVFNMGINFRNGSKGVMFQRNGNWLLEVAALNDIYAYNVRDAGYNPIDLNWDYTSDSAITVVLSRTGETSYNLGLAREGSAPVPLTIRSITLSQVPNEIRFYVFGTDGGGAENNLYFNDLSIITGTIGEAFTDGIPNSWWDQYNIAEINRVGSFDLDNDGYDNRHEFIADTDPTDDTSFFNNVITAINGTGVFSLPIGPTSVNRLYDIWWTTDLLASPQEWNRLGLNVPGNGGTLNLEVTNDVDTRYYRTGVALP